MLPASGLAGKKFLFATSQASVKIVPGEEFMTANKTVVATKLAEDDKLVEIREIGTEVDGERDVVLQTVDGMFLKFPLAEIPELKRTAAAFTRDPSRRKIRWNMSICRMSTELLTIKEKKLPSDG